MESKKKILLVEDEAIIAMTESKLLHKHGYEVVTAHKGEKAVEMVDSNPEISLILMDIDLGKGIDGTEAAQEILEEHDIPIVFLSSHTEPEVVEKTEGITSYGYIVKNSGDTVLLASIKMAFRLYEAHLELKRQKVHLNAALTKYEQKSESLQESEALYRNLMENNIDGVELLDEEGRFLNVNQSECGMLGYSREEMLTMRIADIDPNYPEDGFYSFWKEKPKGDSFLFETIHRHKNGTLIPVEVNGIFFEVNGKKYIYGVARNITERKQAEYDMKVREENLRTTLQSIGDAVISTDLNGNITRMNPVAEKLTGWSVDAAKGQGLHEVFHIIQTDTREVVGNPVKKVLENCEIVRLSNHTALISKEGREYQIADSAAPIKDGEGNINGVVLVFRDVTEQYEKERQVIERIHAEDKLRSIEWMLSNKSTKQAGYIPEYGDVGALNNDGLILTAVGEEQLKDIASEYLNLLETSTAIYEKNGEYALGIFSSGWCQLMDAASRRLCSTEDNQEALNSGKWLCHESCWKDASLSMSKGSPVEIECNGGIKMYAVPILANGEIVGAMNFGYGNPPTDEAELEKLSKKYKISIHELKKQAEAYKSRPQFIIDYAKERIQMAAKTLGYIIENNLTKERLHQDELYLRTILKSTTDSFWVVDSNRNITQVNDAYCRMTGYSKEEFLQMTINDLDAEEKPEEMEARIRRIIQNGSEVFEVKHRRKDGSVFDVEISTTFLNVNGGQFICFCRDITERKRIERELKSKTDFLENITENMFDLLALTDLKGNFIFVGESHKILGYEPSDLIGTNVMAFVHPEDYPYIAKEFNNFLSSEENKKVAYRYKRSDGSYLWFETMGKILTDEEGNPEQILFSTRDITERKENEEELQKALEEKDYLMKELNHRVKNNLAMVSSLISLKNSSLGDDVDLSDLNNRVNAIRLIHEKLYQIEDISHINLKEYIHELVSNVFSLSNKHVEIEEHIDDIFLSTNSAIPLGLIVNELATNTIKHGFTEEGGARFSIDLTEDKTNNQYILIITNTGKPVPIDVTLDNPNSLGLQLISALVSQLEGTIELQREPHPVFTIRFPIEEE